MDSARMSLSPDSTHGAVAEDNAEDHSAAAEHAAEQAYDDEFVPNALSGFLTLGLSHFAKNLTDKDCEHHIAEALADAITQPKTHGDDATLEVYEGALVAKLWDCITLTLQKRAKDPTDVTRGLTFARSIARR